MKKGMNYFMLLWLLFLMPVWFDIVKASSLGDINNDGYIDKSDAMILYQVINNEKTLTNEEKVYADLNLDGNVDEIDLNILRSYLLNDIDTLPYQSAENIVSNASYGDIDLDGRVNVVDAYLIHTCPDNLTSQQKVNGDVNLDGNLDLNDNYIIKNYAAQLINAIPVIGMTGGDNDSEDTSNSCNIVIYRSVKLTDIGVITPDSSKNENTNNDNTTTFSPSETQEDTTSNIKEDTKKEDEIKNPDTGAFAPIGLLLGTIVLSTVILFVIKKHNIFMKI